MRVANLTECGAITAEGLGATKTIKLVFVTSPLSNIKEKEQNWLSRNQDIVFEWGDMSTP
jgi:hypothetical protein